MTSTHPSAAVERSSRSLVYCFARCRECNWTNDSQLLAARFATTHTRETAHTVTVEQGIVYAVRIRDRRP